MSGWFKHGKWPKWMVLMHYYTIGSFILLLLSGIALYWEPVHTVLIPYLPYIYTMHIFLGIIFALTLFVPFVIKFPFGKLIRRLDWFLPTIFGIAIVVTGVFLWKSAFLPAKWTSNAFAWHGWMSYILTGWVLLHIVLKAVGYRPNSNGLYAKVDPSRRQFVIWLTTGALGVAFFMIVDPFELLRRILVHQGTNANTLDDPANFAQYYTVTSGYPIVNIHTYRLHVGGLVKKSASLSYIDIKKLQMLDERVSFHCVTGWSVSNISWKGVHIHALVQLANPDSSVKYVHFYSADGIYTECLTLREALDPTVLLAFELNGEPLTTRQGFPIRLVVPKMYGYKSIKWVNRIEFSDKPLTGYWEARGYPTEAYLGSGMMKSF